jgi:hypothetical protein
MVSKISLSACALTLKVSVLEVSNSASMTMLTLLPAGMVPNWQLSLVQVARLAW